MAKRDRQRQKAERRKRRTERVPKARRPEELVAAVPRWIKVEPATETTGQPKRHWFAPRSEGLVNHKTITKLGLIWAALHIDKLEPDRAGQMHEVPLLTIGFRHRYLTEAGVKYLESTGIPAGSQTPLKFSYPDVLLPHVTESVNKERLFNNLVDLLYGYWSVSRGFKFIVDNKFIEAAEAEEERSEEFIRFISESHGLTREEVLLDLDRGLNPHLLIAKWFADVTIAKLRSMWDKSITWIGRDYYGVTISAKSLGDLSSGRIGQLRAGALDRLSEGFERQFLTAFIAMCCEISELRTYRDNDLHQISPRVPGALGREDADVELAEVFRMMLRELIRITEALLAMFGAIVAQGDGEGENAALTRVEPLEPWAERVAGTNAAAPA